MMLYPPISELVKIAGNRYALVHLVAKKAREMANEEENYGSDKFVTMAVQELVSKAEEKEQDQ